MNIAAYHRQQRQMAGAQEAYDNMLPPEWSEWTCDVCGMAECECAKCDICDKAPCECEPCPNCKRIICNCDEQYEAHKERCYGI